MIEHLNVRDADLSADSIIPRWIAGEQASSGSGAHCFGNVWALEKRVGARCAVQVVRVRCRWLQAQVAASMSTEAGGMRFKMGTLAAFKK